MSDIISDNDVRLNPFPWFKQMREHTPVVFDERFGSWSVFRYNDVQRVLSDHAYFSSQAYSSGNQPLSTSLINLDPPRHRQLRALTTLAFTPRAVARLEERIVSLTNELLNEVEEKGEMDLIEDLAYPLPTMIIAEMLGIPTADRAKFKLWSDQLMGNVPFESDANPQVVMARYYREIFALRRQEPQDDLISALLAAQIDGEYLTDAELLGFCILLLLAGNETTTTLLGNALQAFDEYPEVMEELRADPTLIPAAIEEVLRYRSPIRMLFRSTVQEVELSGQLLAPGQGVVAWLPSANRDPEQFPDADTFDIHRTPNRHLAFGYGIHFCLGAPLARLEARVALEILLQRLTNIKRVREQPLTPIPSRILLGLQHLPLTFSKR